MSWLTWLLTAILDWILAKGIRFVSQEAVKARDKAEDEKINHEIKEKLVNAQTEAQAQEALDAAAAHLNRRD